MFKFLMWGVVFLWQFPLSALILVVAVLLFLLPASNTGLSMSLWGFDLTELPRFVFSRRRSFFVLFPPKHPNCVQRREVKIRSESACY